jgi:hypothetical protein
MVLAEHSGLSAVSEYFLEGARDMSVPQSPAHYASMPCTLRLSEVYDRITFPSTILENADEG